MPGLVGGGTCISLWLCWLSLSGDEWIASNVLYTVVYIINIDLPLHEYYGSYVGKRCEKNEIVVTDFSGELWQCTYYMSQSLSFATDQ